MEKKYQQGAIVFLFLGILAGAFAGSLPKTYGSCFNYPFEDGNGETDTPLNERYTGENYLSLFEYHLNYASSPQEAEGAICSALGFGTYNSEDASTASAWVDSNNVDCSPYLP
jgi:hypothetical protein